MVDFCLNGGRFCNKQVPYAYANTLGDATVRGGDTAGKNFGKKLSLYAQRASDTNPESMIYMKFRIPQGAVDVPSGFRPDYQLRIYGGNTTDSAAAIIRLYRVATDWTEDTITFCLRGNAAGRIYSFGNRDTENPPLQLLITLNPLSY
jgi:hypothetical protein